MLTALIERAAAATPGKAAVAWGDRRLSYGALAAGAGRCAAGLAALGIGPGDAIGVILPNRPELIIAFFAAMRLGAIVAPASPQAGPAELERLLADARPRVLVTDPARLALCRAVAARLPQPPLLVAVEGTDAPSFAALGEGLPVPPDASDGERRALYLYTSGSTDSFKRVCCTQRNLWFEAANFVAPTRLGADDAIFCAVPLHHSYGLGNGLLDAAFLGATLVLEAEPEAPFAARHGAMLRQLSASAASVFLGVPFQYEVLAASPEDVAGAFAGVRWCVSSGDLLRRRTFERFRERTGQPIRSLYGSTEAGSIAMSVDPPAAVRYGDLGPPLANVRIEPRGPAGELWIASPTLPPGGYDDRPALNAAIFRDGFYNSGDCGRLDEQGRLVMIGRKQSFLEVGGHKVDIGEVEEVLLGHPQVREAAVVGVEMPPLGSVLKAVVAADETSRAADLLEHCRQHLAGFKVPRLVEFRETLPRSPLGKVLRAELRAPADWLADLQPIAALPGGARAGRVAWLARRIGEQVAVVLGCPPAAVACDVPFQDLGLDSLRVIELRERLSRLSGVALSVATLWSHPSIEACAAFLLAAMEGSPPAPPAGAEDPLDRIPDGEIAVLLARELGLLPEGA